MARSHIRKLSLTTEKKKFFTAIQRAVVYMEANAAGMVQCISCGKIIPIAEADGGHGEGKGRNVKLSRYRWNIHAQCRYCNRFCEGNQQAWYEGVKAKYGEVAYNYLLDMVAASKGDVEALGRITPHDKYEFIDKKWTAQDYRTARLYWEKVIKENKYKEGV